MTWMIDLVVSESLQQAFVSFLLSFYKYCLHAFRFKLVLKQHNDKPCSLWSRRSIKDVA